MSAYASPTASFSGLPTPPDQRRSSLPFEPNLPPDILPAVAARAAAKWRDFTRQRAGPSLAGLSSALPSSPSHAICLGDVSTGGFGSPAHSPTASSSARSYGSTSSNDEWLFRPHFTTFPIPQASDRRLSTASTASSAPLPAGPAVHHLQRAAGRYEPYATAAASTSTTRCGTNASIATTSTTVAGVNGDASGSTEGKTKEELRRERKRVTNRNSTSHCLVSACLRRFRLTVPLASYRCPQSAREEAARDRGSPGSNCAERSVFGGPSSAMGFID